MGITIHYRGTIDTISDIPLLEDRLLDFVFSMGGQATVCRFFSPQDPSRVVKGLIVNLAAEQEPFSLLFSPEGQLTPLFQIEDAEQGPFHEPPYCFVKTQFGSPQGHIAIVHLLSALKQRFISNLEVLDEGDYYETRDIQQLTDKMDAVQSAIETLADGLRRFSISPEALEDPDILATRIERIAQQAWQSLVEGEPRQSETEAGELQSADGDPDQASLDSEVDAMDRLRLQNEQRIEILNRRIEESLAAGLSVNEAFEQALSEQGLLLPAGSPGVPVSDRQSATTSAEKALPCETSEPAELHPVAAQSRNFLLQAMQLGRSRQRHTGLFMMLEKAAFDILGGLVQATAGNNYAGDSSQRAAAIAQLKRALHGHGYARGAVAGLIREDLLSADQAEHLRAELARVLMGIHELCAVAWRV